MKDWAYTSVSGRHQCEEAGRKIVRGKGVGVGLHEQSLFMLHTEIEHQQGETLPSNAVCNHGTSKDLHHVVPRREYIPQWNAFHWQRLTRRNYCESKPCRYARGSSKTSRRVKSGRVRPFTHKSLDACTGYGNAEVILPKRVNTEYDLCFTCIVEAIRLL